jgi:DNA-3-methyladenine glycosylase I
MFACLSLDATRHQKVIDAINNKLGPAGLTPRWREATEHVRLFCSKQKRRGSDMAAKQDAGSKRCPWASEKSGPAYVAYHDREWGVPVHDDRTHFEFLVLDGAQAGLSWSTILNKRDGYRRAFAGFDPVRVAKFDKRKIERLLRDPGIVRNRLKIESAVKNARAFLKVQKEFGSFDKYIWQFVGGKTRRNKWKTLKQIPCESAESRAMSKDLKSRGFTFVGPTICYAYMQAAGMVNDHLVSCFRHKEVGKRRGK